VLLISGHEHKKQHGVGLLLAQCYNPVSERLMTARFNTSPFSVTYIQVYAPTDPALAKDKDAFYSMLQQVWSDSPKGDVIVIGGYFNAKLGEHNPVFALGTSNNNGDRLTEFCLSNGLVAANALTEKHPRRKYTWIAPSGARNQIDYLLVTKRWQSSLTQCRTFPGADILGCDHKLVAGTLHLKLRKMIKSRKSLRFDMSPLALKKFEERLKINLSKLAAGARKDVLKIRKRIAIGKETDKLLHYWNNVEDQWVELKLKLLEAAKVELKVPMQTHKAWIRPSTWRLIEKKRQARNNVQRLKDLTKKVRLAVSQDKRKMLLDLCKELEMAFKRQDSCAVFRSINRLLPQEKPKCLIARDESGTVLTVLTVMERGPG